MAHFAFVNLPAHGHTNPTLPLVSGLVKRGHRVTYHSTPDFRGVLEKAGAEFRDYGPFPIDHHNPDPVMMAFARDLLKTTQALLPRMEEAFRKEKPDLVFHDSLATWGRLAAVRLGLRHACSTTTFAISPGRVPLSTFLSFIGGMARHPLAVLEFARRKRDLRRDMGISLGLPTDLFRNVAPRNIVYTSRSFQPDGDRLDGSWAFVGPSVDPALLSSLHRAGGSQKSGRGMEDLPDLPPGDAPLVYVSLGTLFNENLGFWKTALSVIGNLPVRGLFSVGKKLDIASLGPIPPNIRVHPRVPQLAVLASARVFVTHGGMNSAHESLLFGVPMVVVPQAADQSMVAHRVEETGTGVALHRNPVRPSSLRRALIKVLADAAMTDRAATLGRELASCGGAEKACDLLETWVREPMNLP